MYEVYYWSKSRFSLDDMAKFVLDKGYQPELFTSGGMGKRLLNIFYDWNAQLFWQVYSAFSDQEILDMLSLEGFEPDDAWRVIDCEPQSFLAISYHYGTRNIFINFLVSLLEKYGGWIGVDDDEFRIYSIDNIDSLNLDYSSEIFSALAPAYLDLDT